MVLQKKPAGQTCELKNIEDLIGMALFLMADGGARTIGAAASAGRFSFPLILCELDEDAYDNRCNHSADDDCG